MLTFNDALENAFMLSSARPIHVYTLVATEPQQQLAEAVGYHRERAARGTSHYHDERYFRADSLERNTRAALAEIIIRDELIHDIDHARSAPLLTDNPALRKAADIVHPFVGAVDIKSLLSFHRTLLLSDDAIAGKSNDGYLFVRFCPALERADVFWVDGNAVKAWPRFRDFGVGVSVDDAVELDDAMAEVENA